MVPAWLSGAACSLGAPAPPTAPLPPPESPVCSVGDYAAELERLRLRFDILCDERAVRKSDLQSIEADRQKTAESLSFFDGEESRLQTELELLNQELVLVRRHKQSVQKRLSSLSEEAAEFESRGRALARSLEDISSQIEKYEILSLAK